jgi:uncharacterized membrane-anchored protein
MFSGPRLAPCPLDERSPLPPLMEMGLDPARLGQHHEEAWYDLHLLWQVHREVPSEAWVSPLSRLQGSPTAGSPGPRAEQQPTR